MKMPGTVTCPIRKKYCCFLPAIVFLVLIAITVSWAAADDAVPNTCNDSDRFGNPVCPGTENDLVFPGQENSTQITLNHSAITGTIGRLRDFYPVLQESSTELAEIATLGIKGSLNQTRNAGSHPGPGDEGPTRSTNSSGFQDLKLQVTELAEIAGTGLKSSINQTLHADDYPSLTDTGPGNISESIPGGNPDGPPPNILRATYAAMIGNIRLFVDITPRALAGSLRNYSKENKSIWKAISSDDLIGSPLAAPVPDERFLREPDLPVTRRAINITPDLPSLLANVQVPNEIAPVLPAPTPVPVPTFNLSVDSDPDGALIVINGNRTGTTPFIITGLGQDTYTLNLTRAGYVAHGEVVILDMDKSIDVPLTPTMDTMFVTPGKSGDRQNSYGGLYVTSYPDRLGLTIDGVDTPGGTPFLYYGFPEGLHTIRVQRTDKPSGAVTYTRSVWVYHDALNIINIDTEEALLAKRVSVNPGPYSGAEFTINGRYPPGRLPATISAGCPGSFISVRKGDEYSSFLIPCTNQDTVVMSLEKSTEPHPSLLVTSAPEGAEIFIDGFRTGYTTPHTFTGVSGGLHRVMVSKPGLYPVEQLVTVEIRGTDTAPQKVYFTMENYGEGTLVVDSLPGGASIFLNGWSPGETTPHIFDHMKIGFYEIIVQMDQKPWIEQVELTPSKVSKVVADFEV